jgi:hypothetical protein
MEARKMKISRLGQRFYSKNTINIVTFLDAELRNSINAAVSEEPAVIIFFLLPALVPYR